MKVERRKIDFSDGNAVIDDIQHLHHHGYRRAGNWNLTQICQHLEKTMTGGMDGFGFRLPWILRKTVIQWAFDRALKKRSLPAGAPTLKMLRPVELDAAAGDADEDEAVINACIAAVRRAQDFPGPMKDYPLLEDPPVDRWRDFMWIHAAHHLSFLVPRDADDSGANS
ncbi:DUF1569 domain-containing protein [Crateriforma conspicua]|uniref:DUF1569 domain-containing protein n=1 Tax=Crateriforma conspicua TaxID=2527996 RepID=UPI001189A400|nr:DUF1569 domain-containing protein [Crateriforma conspicua]QDV64367.1 hypothetical protein Mal65_35210 [Crateriforma conspicua]